jgi:hypothetical protein
MHRGESQTKSVAPQMKIFSHYCGQRNERIVTTAFEVKKEIPAKQAKLLFLVSP